MTKLKVITEFIGIGRIFYAICTLIFVVFSNPFHQAINYAVSLNSKSQDLVPRVAISSHSFLYFIIKELSELSVNPRQISFLINFFLLFLLLNGLGSTYSLLGFSSTNAILLSVFSTFTYTFASAISYEIQVSGPITQARLTPILIIYVLNALCGKKNKRTTTKITLLIVLSLWVHLVIGLFLAVFVLIKTWKNKPDKPFRSATIINTSIAILFFLLLYKWNSNPENSSMTAGRWIETALNNPFCQHYTNVFNLFDSKNSTRVLSALLTFFGSIIVIHLISTLDKKPEENGTKSRETETLETIKYFYGFALLATVSLNLAIIKSNPFTIYSLGSMPFRFLDAANFFAFPILIYAVRRFQGEVILLPILSLLILGRILNARIFGFYLHENNVHFLILFLLTLIFYLSHRAKLGIGTRIFSPRSRGILAILLVVFLSTQIFNESKKPNIYWNEIAKANAIIGFAGSTILTAPEVRFPIGLNGNMELLSHPELQSILYVPESTSYVENLLKKYYSTNLQEYFAGNSCALLPTSKIRKTWTARSQSDWKRMAAEDGFSFIVVPREWQMKIKPELTIGLLEGDRQSRFTIYRP